LFKFEDNKKHTLFFFWLHKKHTLVLKIDSIISFIKKDKSNLEICQKNWQIIPFFLSNILNKMTK